MTAKCSLDSEGRSSPATLYQQALLLNAAAYRATEACAYGESDWRVVEIRKLSVAIAPLARQAMTAVSLQDLGGLRSGLARLMELVEDSRALGLIAPEATARLVSHAANLSRALTMQQNAIRA